MTIRSFNKTIVYTVLYCVLWAPQPAAACDTNGDVVLQVLGSGGPIADDGRASTGYLVWVDGKSRALIDTGGGIFLRFGEAGASFADLDFIGLSHLHTDHSADGRFHPHSYRQIRATSRRANVRCPSRDPRARALSRV